MQVHGVKEYLTPSSCCVLRDAPEAIPLRSVILKMEKKTTAFFYDLESSSRQGCFHLSGCKPSSSSRFVFSSLPPRPWACLSESWSEKAKSPSWAMKSWSRTLTLWVCQGGRLCLTIPAGAAAQEGRWRKGKSGRWTETPCSQWVHWNARVGCVQMHLQPIGYKKWQIPLFLASLLTT